MPNGMVHPVALFHVPMMGAKTSIAEMFELGQAESDLSVIPEYYEWLQDRETKILETVANLPE